MNGLILLDKPEGFTSFKAAAALRSIYGTKRIGHTGTLDPMATGVLPILIGRATRLCSYVLEADKRYTAGVRLGITTDSLDITGEVISEMVPDISDEKLAEALQKFTGTYDQVPPMFSAIKKDGVRLYDLARQGVEVERQPRKITVYDIKLLHHDGNDFVIDVLCSKGTYIRSLADDIGAFLGCGAVLTSLRRTSAASFSIEQCVTLEQIKDNKEGCLLSAEMAVAYLREVEISLAQGKRFVNGAALSADRVNFFADAVDNECFRIKSDGKFLGLAEYNAVTNELCTKCVITE